MAINVICANLQRDTELLGKMVLTRVTVRIPFVPLPSAARRSKLRFIRAQGKGLYGTSA